MQWKPLDVISLGRRKTYNINRVITISKDQFLVTKYLSSAETAINRNYIKLIYWFYKFKSMFQRCLIKIHNTQQTFGKKLLFFYSFYIFLNQLIFDEN